MGGSSKPKMIVTRYYLSGHWGICQKADAIRDIRIGEKVIWKGMARNNGTINVAREGLFGGMKKEGGAKGGIDVMLGGDNQVPPKSLISRLRIAASNVPGFRGITSLMFHGGAFWDGDVYGDPVGGDGGNDFGESRSIFGVSTSIFARFAYRNSAFYWGTQPYLKPLWVTVQRIPARELSPATAPVPGGLSSAYSLCLCLDQSGSMLETVGGKTRMDVQKEEVINALQAVGGSLVGGGSLAIVGYGLLDSAGSPLPQTFFRYGVTPGDVDAAIAFVDALYAQVLSDTDWAVGMKYASDFHLAASTTPLTIFLTDGSPGRVGASQQTVLNDTLAERDRVSGHQVHTIGIDMSSTSWLAQVDNTPEDGVPNVTSADGGAVQSAILAALQDVLIFNANPAHVIYECLTDTDWGMGADSSAVDLVSFKAAGEVLFDENFGIAMAWMAQSSIEDFINDILAHIQGAIFPHPRTGKITLKLLRDDLDLGNLKEITPDNANLTSFSRKGWGETVNEVVVTWTNPATEKEETVYAQDLANIAQQGGVVSSSKNYHGVRTVGLANRLAERDLREESAPLCSAEVEVNREFWDVTPFEGVKVTWPEYGLDGLVMRVMKVNYGDSSRSTIKLSLVEDVFSLPLASYIAPVTGEWQDPSAPPAPVVAARLLPIPTYVASRSGVDLDTLSHPATGLVPLATNPTTAEGATYDVLREVATASGGSTWEQELGDVPFAATAELPESLPPEVETPGLVLDNLFGEGPQVDDLLLIGDDDLPDDALELALVAARDPETGALILRRGMLDTVPREWPAGTKVAITREFHWRPLPREFLDGQSVMLKFLTSTPGGMLEEYQAPEFTGLARVRAVLPTRPANLRAYGQLAPDPATYPTYPVTVTWSHRNRLLEDAIMLAWDEGDIPVEPGVEYRMLVEAIQEDGTVDGVAADIVQTGTTYDVTEALLGTALAGSPFVRVSVWALRDGLASWQAAQIAFRGPFRAPVILYGDYRDPQAPGNVTAVIVP